MRLIAAIIVLAVSLALGAFAQKYGRDLERVYTVETCDAPGHCWQDNYYFNKQVYR